MPKTKSYSVSHAINPIDGRYFQETSEIRAVFSEFGLMKNRLKVELAWFKTLASQAQIEQVKPLSMQELAFLEGLIDNFSENDFDRIQEIEKVTRHDVKAIEYFLKEKMEQSPFENLKNEKEFVHFSCTSDDINNVAYALMLKDMRDKVILPYMDAVIDCILNEAEKSKTLPMLAKTHGQPATPTTLGKEWANFAVRLKKSRNQFAKISIHGKMNGAVGNYNAHDAAYPDINWEEFSKQVVEDLGIKQTKMTTQIEPHDYIARMMNELSLFANQLKGLDLNKWLEISDGKFNIKLEKGQVGSSTMPHKINPIHFENSEGNLDLLIDSLQKLAVSLTTSRHQRDLTDSTKMRYIGETSARMVLAMRSFLAGMSKLQTDEKAFISELDAHWELLAEPIQTVMRRYDVDQPYERLKALTQGAQVTKETMMTFLDTLDGKIPTDELAKLKALTPTQYIGKAPELTEQAIKKCRTAKKSKQASDIGSQVSAVVGMQWGDEGKGKIVDLQASSGQFEIVARYNGGANAGHSLKVGENDKLATHLMPSGILNKGVMNVIGNGVVLDPWQLLKEIRNIQSKGIEVTADNLKISDRCHLVLPYHKEEDALNEAILSKEDGAIGTTKKGIGPCYADKDNRSTAIRFCDLYDEHHLHELLTLTVRNKQIMHSALAESYGLKFDTSAEKVTDGANGEKLNPYNVEQLFIALKEVAQELKSYKTNTANYLQQEMKKGKSILVEGANAFQLDKDFGTYPYVTSSNASVNGIPAGLGIPPQSISYVTGIVKAYTSRVGAGEFPTELAAKTGNKAAPDYDPNYIGNRIREKGREYGTTTGRPRRCGWLDLMPIKNAIETSGINALSIMLLDVLADQGELQICTGYELDGSVLAFGNMPADSDSLGRCKPIYKSFPGFSDITQCRSYTSLPQAARDYLLFIEDTLGKPIEYISYGPERNQTLYVKGGLRYFEQKIKDESNQLHDSLSHSIECMGELKQHHLDSLKELQNKIQANLEHFDFDSAKKDLVCFLDTIMTISHKFDDRISGNDIRKPIYMQCEGMRGFFNSLINQNTLQVLFGDDIKSFQSFAEQQIKNTSRMEIMDSVSLSSKFLSEAEITQLLDYIKADNKEQVRGSLIYLCKLQMETPAANNENKLFKKHQAGLNCFSSYQLNTLIGVTNKHLIELAGKQLASQNKFLDINLK